MSNTAPAPTSYSTSAYNAASSMGSSAYRGMQGMGTSASAGWNSLSPKTQHGLIALIVICVVIAIILMITLIPNFIKPGTYTVGIDNTQLVTGYTISDWDPDTKYYTVTPTGVGNTASIMYLSIKISHAALNIYELTAKDTTLGAYVYLNTMGKTTQEANQKTVAKVVTDTKPSVDPVDPV